MVLRYIGVAVVVAALIAAISRPAAAADSLEERFAAAANLLAEERFAAAAAEFEALARAAPDHALAPEALFAAGEIYEEKLADPARALALYGELGRRYPDNRRTLAASRRASALVEQTGSSAEGLAAQQRFLAIRQGYAARSEAESFAMAEALVRDHPDWPGAPAVALWLAGLDARAGRYEAALRRYLAAAERYAAPEARFDALRGAGDMALALHRFDEAERHYRALDPRGDPGRAAAIADALTGIREARGRWHWLWLSLIASTAGFLALIVSLAAGRPRASLRALWPPPSEVLYLAPVAVVLSAVAYTDYPGLGPAVTAVSAGGVAATWLSGAGLTRWRRLGARPRRALAIGHALAAGLAILGLVYAALYAADLLDAVVDTLRHGPEQ